MVLILDEALKVTTQFANHGTAVLSGLTRLTELYQLTARFCFDLVHSVKHIQ